MTTLREAAKQALEALKCLVETYEMQNTIRADINDAEDAITALKAALEQPEQDVPETVCGNMEPVAWMYEGIRHDGTAHGPHLVWKTEYMDAMSANKGAKAVPLYTHPPRREWKGLSEDEMGHIYVRSATHEEFARAIEAKLKERNP